MKQMKTWMLALLVMVGIGLTSCMNSDGDYTPSGGGVVEVKYSWMGTYFIDVFGNKIIPTATSLSVVETQNKFKPSETRVAYILFTYPEEGNEDITTSKEIKNANLAYAMSLDQKFEEVHERGSSNDSISTAPIRRINSVMGEGDGKELYLFNGRYLLTGIEYYGSLNNFGNNKNHYFTLVQYADETEDGKLTFHLRHSGEPEAANVYSTSLDGFNWGFPYVYMKSFDLYPYLTTGEQQVEIHTKVNLSDNKLENATDKIYSVSTKASN